MTATLRYDVGTSFYNAIDDKELIDRLDAKTVRRWKGHNYGGYAECISFSIRLPSQTELAFKLFLVSSSLAQDTIHLVSKSALALHKKLQLSLGLPIYLQTVIDLEKQFLNSISLNPSDLGNWSAYSDWLQDQQEEHTKRRGLVIAGWLGPKAIKVKYGVPLLATETINCE